MELIDCKKCNDTCERRRMTRKNKEGITELYNIIYHRDGTKEKKVWATLRGEEILSAQFI